MQSTHKLVLISLAVVGYLVSIIDGACICAPSHPQERYCKADFVIKAKVRNSSMIPHKDYLSPYQKKYNVRIKHIYKAPEGFRNLTSWEIRTTPKISSCGVHLKKGKRYLIEGKMVKGQPFITICNSIYEWKNMSHHQRKGFNHLYGKHCNCEIHRCQKPECKTRPDVCYWNWKQHPNCYSSYSLCYNKNGQCQWRRSKHLKSCLAAKQKEGKYRARNKFRRHKGSRLSKPKQKNNKSRTKLG